MHASILYWIPSFSIIIFHILNRSVLVSTLQQLLQSIFSTAPIHVGVLPHLIMVFICVCLMTSTTEPFLCASLSLATQTVKRLSTMKENWVRSLSREDCLEKEMATHPSTAAQKIPWTEKPGVNGVTKSQTRLSDFTFTLSLSIYSLL